MSVQRLKMPLALVLVAVMAGCGSKPRGPSAEVRAVCIPPEAAPAIPVADLYRRCREAALAEDPEVEMPAVDWGRR